MRIYLVDSVSIIISGASQAISASSDSICPTHDLCWWSMKTTVQLDYHAILANSAQPVYLALEFTAPGHSGHRDHPIAFLSSSIAAVP